jgi:hypothetical protein
VIDRVARADGVDVQFGFAQRVANAGEGAWAVIQEQGELRGNLHKQESFCKTADVRAVAQRAICYNRRLQLRVGASAL